MQLRTYVAPGRAARASKRALTIEPGTRNANGQVVLGPAGVAGDDLPGQRLHQLCCERCGHQYLTPGIRVHLRKCPRCGGGKPGAAPAESGQASLF